MALVFRLQSPERRTQEEPPLVHDSGVPWEGAPHTGGTARPKTSVRPSRLISGSFNKQENFHRRFVLSGLKIGLSLHPPTRI